MQLGPSFDKVVRIAGTVASVLLLAGAGYLLVQGTQTTSDTSETERGFLPTIEKIFQSDSSPPSEPPPTKTSSPPSPKTAANCSISSFTADPDAIAPGDSSTLSWSTDAASASISNIGSVEPSGSRTVSPSGTTKYVLTATCSNGTTVEKGLGVTVEVVTGVSVDVNPASATCPATFNFTGTITTSVPATVAYYWARSDGQSTQSQSLAFNQAGSQIVTYSWPGANASGSVKLIVTSPNEKGNGASFTCS